MTNPNTMQAMREKIELLPCPFCGNPDISLSGGDEEWRFVMCSTCGAHCADIDTLPEKDCVAVWNGREAQPSPYDAIVAHSRK